MRVRDLETNEIGVVASARQLSQSLSIWAGEVDRVRYMINAGKPATAAAMAWDLARELRELADGVREVVKAFDSKPRRR